MQNILLSERQIKQRRRHKIIEMSSTILFVTKVLILVNRCEAMQQEFYFDRTTVNNMADLGSDVTLKEQVSLHGKSKMRCVFGCASHDGCGWALTESNNCIFAGHSNLPGDVIAVTTWPVKAFQKRNNTQAAPAGE